METTIHKITMVRHYIKECSVQITGNYTSDQAMKKGLDLTDNQQYNEGPLEYLGDLDEFSIKKFSPN